MNIEILDIPNQELRDKIHQIYESKENIKDTELEKKALVNIKNILSNREIKEMFITLQDYKFISDMSYEGLAKVEESARVLSENLTQLKTQVELDKFLSKGYNLDINALKEKYRSKGLRKDFPDLDFKKIRELYVYPPKYIPAHYDERSQITIDSFVFRKYIIAILQMVFNHMDFVVCNIGDEGAGKSCKCSQDMYILWWIMTQIGLIDYKFEITEMFANTLRRFSELEDKYYGVPFRIIGLDEGNELNRQDWKEDDVKLFWQRLRRERHEQRIKFINIPVLGEMIINIVLSRINFIFNMINQNETRTGTLYKGDYDFYIIPRGYKIFSPFLNRELTKEEIKNKLYLNLKDKEYLKGLPKDIKIKRCHCNGIWGFNEKEYIKKLKETNRQYTISKGIKFGLTELYSFYKAEVTLPKLGVKKTDAIYHSLKKMIYKIRGFWNNDLQLLNKYDHIFEQKMEVRKQNARGLYKSSSRDKKDANVETTDNL